MLSHKELLADLFRQGVRAALGRDAIALHSTVEGDCWRYSRGGQRLSVQLPHGGSKGRVLVIGAGKAAASLAAGLEQVLGERVDDGLVIVKSGHGEPLRRVQVFEGAHPTPDESSLRATRQLLKLLDGTCEADVVFFVLSGGASSLLFAPAAGVPYEAKVEAVRRLVNSGAPIEQINVVRKRLSAVKGGRLRLRARRARFCTLAVSDVVGDDPATIGSGPTVPDSSTFADALSIVHRHGLVESLPAAVMAHLRRGAERAEKEPPGSRSSAPAESAYQIVANNRLSMAACLDAAERLGYPVELVSERMRGDTHDAARSFATVLRKAANAMPHTGRARLFLAGGETTLAVAQGGKGGRNQEFALTAALELQGLSNVTLLSAGTDGTDGPTDAAGAFADGTTIARARASGFEPNDYLRQHNVYPLLDALGELFRTGPTGTNVMDLVIGVVS